MRKKKADGLAFGLAVMLAGAGYAAVQWLDRQIPEAIPQAYGQKIRTDADSREAPKEAVAYSVPYKQVRFNTLQLIDGSFARRSVLAAWVTIPDRMSPASLAVSVICEEEKVPAFLYTSAKGRQLFVLAAVDGTFDLSQNTVIRMSQDGRTKDVAVKTAAPPQNSSIQEGQTSALGKESFVFRAENRTEAPQIQASGTRTSKVFSVQIPLLLFGQSPSLPEPELQIEGLDPLLAKANLEVTGDLQKTGWVTLAVKVQTSRGYLSEKEQKEIEAAIDKASIQIGQQTLSVQSNRGEAA